MTTQELAQKILALVEQTEEYIGDTKIITTQDVTRLLKLKDDIKQLCQEEVQKP